MHSPTDTCVSVATTPQHGQEERPARVGRSSARASSVGALLEWARKRLGSSSGSPRLDAEALLAFTLDRPRSSLIGFPESGVPARQAARYLRLIEQRAEGMPVAYLTGWREFHSLPLRVSNATLVPRPETELLVDAVLDRLPDDAPARVLDAGSGCGAIALAIKYRRPRCRMLAVEYSAPALRVAASNGARLGLLVDWVRSHWFNALKGDRFDFIAANPPYVAAGDEALMGGDLRHEPRLALDGGADGLGSLREIIADAPRVLARGGTLLLEHGFDQARRVCSLMGSGGFRGLETLRDLAGHDRVTIGRLP